MLKAVLLVAKAGAYSQEKLINAIESRDVEKVRTVLKHRPEAPNRNLPGDYVPLLLATSLGYEEIVEEFIKGQADLSTRNDDLDTALHIASRKGHVKVVEKLLDAKADPLAKNKNLVTPLLSAVTNRQYEVATLLLAAKSDVNAKDSDGLTALMHAARQGDLPMVTSLLEHGADVNARGLTTTSSLVYAVEGGHLDVVVALLAEGATYSLAEMVQHLLDRPSLTVQGHWAIARHVLTCEAGRRRVVSTDGDAIFRLLYRAWQEGQSDLVREVLGDAPLTLVKPEQAMILAAGVGDALVVRELAANRTPVDAVDAMGRTALCLAAMGGNVSVVEELILWGAEVNYTDPQDVTPLICAVRGGHSRTARMLLSHGADVDYDSKAEGPALAVAVELNHPEVVDLLLGHQADLRLAHRSGSLVSLATSRGYHAILRLLLASGAKPSDPGAFYMAVDHEDLVALRMLLSSGADANIKVRDGETALLLACRLGRPLAATLLLQYKADPSIADPYGSDCLVVAAVNGHITVVTALLSNGARMDSLTHRLVSDTLAEGGFNRMQIREALSSVPTRPRPDVSTRRRDSITTAYSLITTKPQQTGRRNPAYAY